jgi:hypothetical protein
MRRRATSKRDSNRGAGSAAARYLVPIGVALAVTACLGPRPTIKGDGGGDTGAGGNRASGGSSGGGIGGSVGSGGAAGLGGAAGSGGKVGAGGSTGLGGTGMGGQIGTGGAAGSGGASLGGATGTGGAIEIIGPCDLMADGRNPCVAAHSTVRALYGRYTGPLYQVCRGTAAAGPNSCANGTTMDIGVITGGYANAAAQNAFCAGMTCTISIIYDQSGNGNHLQPGPAGGGNAAPDRPANATDLPTTLNGHAAFGVAIKPGVGYRAGCSACGVVTATGTATGDAAETIYMVTSATGLVNGCCFDYGNAQTDARDDGNGTMEAINFSGGVVWGTGSPGGHNNGPWVMADLENGLYAGWENNQDQNISTNTPINQPFVTALLIGDSCSGAAGCLNTVYSYPMGHFALFGSDATSGSLQLKYDGVRPAKPGYVPMQKKGSIVLGISGDNSADGAGQFFEGAMASGAATAITLNPLQGNIIGAGYGK